MAEIVTSDEIGVTWQVDAWVSTYTAIANGEFAAVTDDVARLTGHPATPFAELLRGAGSAY